MAEKPIEKENAVRFISIRYLRFNSTMNNREMYAEYL